MAEVNGERLSDPATRRAKVRQSSLVGALVGVVALTALVTGHEADDGGWILWIVISTAAVLTALYIARLEFKEIADEVWLEGDELRIVTGRVTQRIPLTGSLRIGRSSCSLGRCLEISARDDGGNAPPAFAYLPDGWRFMLIADFDAEVVRLATRVPGASTVPPTDGGLPFSQGGYLAKYLPWPVRRTILLVSLLVGAAAMAYAVFVLGLDGRGQGQGGIAVLTMLLLAFLLAPTRAEGEAMHDERVRRKRRRYASPADR